MPQAAEEKSEQEAILREIDSFIDESIDKMTLRQIKQFRKKSARIMKESSLRVQQPSDTHESAESQRQAHRA
jgi:hypothetical protein